MASINGSMIRRAGPQCRDARVINAEEMSGNPLASSRTLEERVARLEEIEAIKKLKMTYLRLCDTGYDVAKLASLFTEDAVWESNTYGIIVVQTGRQAIMEFLQDFGRQTDWNVHFATNPQIEIADDRESARGEWYLFEPATMVSLHDAESRDAVVITGFYEDTYVKVAGEWKFAHVRVHVHQSSNLDQGWAKQRFRGSAEVDPPVD